MKKIVYVLFALLFLASCSNKNLGYTNLSDDNVFKKISYSELEKKVENKESFYLYVGRPTCEHCQKASPTIDSEAKAAGIKEISYIDTDSLSKADGEKFFKKYSVSGTPAVIMFDQGTMKDSTDASVNPAYSSGSYTTNKELYSAFYKSNPIK